MSLTRKSLKEMGIEDEKIDQIIEDHSETVAALKEQRRAAEEQAEGYKAQAEQLAAVQKELDELKAQPANEFEAKYNTEHEAFEAFKADVEAQKAKAEKTELYKALLTKAGIGQKYLEKVLKVTDIDAVEVEEGAIKGADELVKGIQDEWPEFVASTTTQGANVQTPPQNMAGGVTQEQFRKMGYSERAELYKSNPEAYTTLASKE